MSTKNPSTTPEEASLVGGAAGVALQGNRRGSDCFSFQQDKLNVKHLLGENGEADPPLLTGGLLQKRHDELNIDIVGVDIDFLTITVPESTSSDLLTFTQHDEAGSSGRGFSSSERRLTMGGGCWRRFNPVTPHKDYALDYESWEWSGRTSRWPAEWLRGREGRPSRVDIAFDYTCSPDYMADDWIEAYSRDIEERRMSVGISGQNGVNTRYVGSSKSERRIRIYRKDLRDAVIGDLLGPTLRVEIVLKKRHADAFWHVWNEDIQQAWSVAAAHIFQMSGFVPCDSVGQVPSLEIPEVADPAQLLFHFINQNHEMIATIDDAGIPLLDLAKQKSAKRRGQCRMAASRARKRRELFTSVPLVDLLDVATRRLGLTSYP